MYHDDKLATWPGFNHVNNSSLSHSEAVGIHYVMNNDRVEAAQSEGMLFPFQNGPSFDLSQGKPSLRRRNYSVGVDDRIRCHCKKSQCLKLYCDCFNSTMHCGESCECENCMNKAEHMEKLDEVKKQNQLILPQLYDIIPNALAYDSMRDGFQFSYFLAAYG